ncbi:MutH/Sau3AI family endonuclease [Neobacillus sp. BF23-41]|uniref:MutH/Sau3AI family endonuclease n=1 Tax=Neobacillus sp. BF23-41 TaxID=3240280 RepID=UPI0034E48807
MKAQEPEGKTIGEINVINRLNNTKAKGGLGQVIEERFFGYTINSESRQDFEHLCFELKVIPFKLNKNGTISAKELLVFNLINIIQFLYRSISPLE